MLSTKMQVFINEVFRKIWSMFNWNPTEDHNGWRFFNSYKKSIGWFRYSPVDAEASKHIESPKKSLVCCLNHYTTASWTVSCLGHMQNVWFLPLCGIQLILNSEIRAKVEVTQYQRTQIKSLYWWMYVTWISSAEVKQGVFVAYLLCFPWIWNANTMSHCPPQSARQMHHPQYQHCACNHTRSWIPQGVFQVVAHLLNHRHSIAHQYHHKWWCHFIMMEKPSGMKWKHPAWPQ